MSGNMWYGFLRFLNLLDNLTTYFSIQLGRCVLLSFPVLALILILRRGVFMKTTFLKGMVWGIFTVVPFLGKLSLFYDRADDRKAKKALYNDAAFRETVYLRAGGPGQ